MKFIARGFGLGLLSSSSTEIPYPGVAFRPLASEDDFVSCRAVWLPGNDNPALRRFLSLARAMSPERSETTVPMVSG